MNRSILITGANSGLGKDAARQLALLKETELIYLACRNEGRAIEAKKELEAATGRTIFKIVLMDVSSPESVKKAVSTIKEPIDALILNAGGMGGKQPGEKTKDGVTQMFAANVLGHAVLVDEMLKSNKINKTVLYVSTEAVRGVKQMGMKKPELKNSSADEFVSIIDGSYFGSKMDPMQAYGPIKYTATMWMAALARKNPAIRFISVSPGQTDGTRVMDDMPAVMRFIFKNIAMPFILPMLGMVHKLEKGAARFVEGINNEQYKSGIFYASKNGSLTGNLVDQSSIFPDLSNLQFQDNAYDAVYRFIH